MRIGYVTTWDERCGLAAYTENIVYNMPADVKALVISRSMWPNMVGFAQGCDLVHIMHHGGLMAWMTADDVRACGKTVITRQCIGHEPVFDAATVKTAHNEIPGYRFIPHGIPVVNEASLIPSGMGRPLHIGCAGIPFNGKGHWEAVQIAELAGCGVVLVLPENPHTSNDLTKHITDYCNGKNIPYWIETEWLPEQDVVARLSWPQVNVFYYTRPANGVSGAVRMGLAARRPTIVSQHSQFQDLIDAGCVTVADSIEHAAELVKQHETLVRPDSIVEAWGYDKTARMYYDIYREVLGVRER